MARILRNGTTPVYVCMILLLSLLTLRLSSHLLKDDVPSLQTQRAILGYFERFEGYSECNISAADLYIPSQEDDFGFYASSPFCHNRKQLLKALSEGGRVGVDAPYQPRGCKYRWFTVEETCFVLERFDGVVFLGDDNLETIYSGLNILLRQDLALGALDQTSMDRTLQKVCRCNNQYFKADCQRYYLSNSGNVGQKLLAGASYFCNRVPHTLLKTDSPQLKPLIIERFKQLISQTSHSKYKPVPLIVSVSPVTMSVQDAVTLFLKIVELANHSERNTPILWIGPNAASHIELKGQKGNQEIWDFNHKLIEIASQHNVDVLAMWNMTVQATSWDGMRFGEQVAITQAMMVLNWLSRLESS